MASSLAASITIGGTLPASRLQEFYDVVDAEGVGYSWGEYNIGSFEEFAEEVRAGGEFTVMDTEARHGMFPGIEEFCQKNNLTFVRNADGNYEYDAEVVWWAPGMTTTAYSLGTQDGDPVIEVSKLRVAMEMPTSEEKLATIAALIEKTTPVTVPPLVVDEEG